MNSKKTKFTIYNTYEGLNIEDSTDINSTTCNLKRKLEKKIREIEKLELKDTRLLTETQRQKISKKDELLQQLENELDKEAEYNEKEKLKEKCKKRKLKKKKKKEETFNKIKENLEKEQREYKEKQEEKRNKEFNAYNERWKKRMKEMEEEREQRRRNEEQRRRNEEQRRRNKEQREQKDISKYENDILNACKLLNINLNELNGTNLKKSYRGLMRKHHPDKRGGNEELTKQITSANLLLKKYLNI